MKRVQDRVIFKISLLSISLSLMISQQIAPALPMMYHAFPGVGRSAVESLSTVPSFGIVVGLFANVLLIKWVGTKKNVMIGLLITLLAGLFPMFSNSYFPILISRFLSGVGIGLFNSLAVSLIPYFYKDNEETLATMIGIQNVMASLGVIISSLLVSWLVTYGWHAAFAIYFLTVPVLIMFGLFVPIKDEEAGTSEEQQDTTTEKHHINSKVILIAILFFLGFTFYMPTSYALPRLIVNEGIGSSSTAGVIAAISGALTIPFGMGFGHLFKRLHDKIFPLSYLALALGFLLMAIGHQLIIVFIGNVLASIGLVIMCAYLYNWLDWAAPQNSVNLATTVVLIIQNIGTSLSPTIVDGLSGLLGNGSAATTMSISAVVFLMLTIYGLLHYRRVHSPKKATRTN